MKKKILILIIILAGAIAAGIIQGSVKIPLRELLFKDNRLIIDLRLFRIIAAILVGSGLSVSGIALQAILRNSLAEPYLLGTSSGAGLGAVIAVSLGLSSVYFPLSAFLGAVLSIIIVYQLAKQNNRVRAESLILSGVVVSVAFYAVMVFLISISRNEAIYGLAWWFWGSLQVHDLSLLIIVSIIVLLGICAIYILSQDLNAMSLGDEEAMHLGIKTELIKKILIVVVALITSSLVCICGIIGFVGLIIPHMMRMLVGSNHKILIPVTCLAAAIFMIICDIFSRTLIAPQEIPIGIITALIGAPLFFVLLKKQQKTG